MMNLNKQQFGCRSTTLTSNTCFGATFFRNYENFAVTFFLAKAKVIK